MNKYIPVVMMLVALALIAFAYLVAPEMANGAFLSDILFIVASIISVTGAALALWNERSN